MVTTDWLEDMELAMRMAFSLAGWAPQTVTDAAIEHMCHLPEWLCDAYRPVVAA